MRAAFTGLLLAVVLASFSAIAQPTPDQRREFEKTKALAEQGNAEAQHNLGVMYQDGLGVEKDYAEAVKWYRKAAEQGEARAQYNLGAMYTNGEGVEKDYVEAYAWLNLSSFSDTRGATARDELVKQMSPEQIVAGYKRTKELKAIVEANKATKEKAAK